MKSSLRIISTITVLLTISNLLGCGTTHHFIPARPLEKNDWQISISWHYEFSKRYLPMVIPEVSAYTGLGRNFNLGFGAQAPFFLSHVSAIKYYDQIDGNFAGVYGHINQIFGANNNPYLELGGLYTINNGSFRQIFQGGLAYGNGLIAPLSRGLLSHRNKGWPFNRFMPVIKYQLSGSDIALSYVHYHGMTSAAYSGIKYQIESDNDTLAILDSADVNSIELLKDNDRSFLRPDSWAVFLSNGDTLILVGRHISPDVGFYRNLASSDIQALILSDGYDVYSSSEFGFVVINAEQRKRDWQENRKIVITRFPVEYLDLINKRKDILSDHSFGFSIQAHVDNNR